MIHSNLHNNLLPYTYNRITLKFPHTIKAELLILKSYVSAILIFSHINTYYSLILMQHFNFPKHIHVASYVHTYIVVLNILTK